MPIYLFLFSFSSSFQFSFRLLYCLFFWCALKFGWWCCCASPAFIILCTNAHIHRIAYRPNIFNNCVLQQFYKIFYLNKRFPHDLLYIWCVWNSWRVSNGVPEYGSTASVFAPAFPIGLDLVGMPFFIILILVLFHFIWVSFFFSFFFGCLTFSCHRFVWLCIVQCIYKYY